MRETTRKFPETASVEALGGDQSRYHLQTDLRANKISFYTEAVGISLTNHKLRNRTFNNKPDLILAVGFGYCIMVPSISEDRHL